MKAMILERQGQIKNHPLHLMDVAEPWPLERQVRVKVSACAVCRTDLHVVEGELPVRQSPLIPGHQIVGVVEVLGKKASKFREGDRVGAGWLGHTCQNCPYCLGKQENLCESSQYHGFTRQGGYAEYVVVDEDYLFSIPSNLSDVEAAPLLCSGVIGFRAYNRAEVPAGGTLGLFGFGSSAHLMLTFAKNRGTKVFVLSRSPGHLDLAKQMGADWVGTRALDLPRKMDSIILFAPSGELVPVALASLRKGGTLSIAGIYVSDIPSLDWETHLFYEKKIHSVTSHTREDARQFLHEAARNPIVPKIQKYRLEDANHALEDLKSGRVNGTAVLTIT